jgi:hypothetical protein
MSQIGQPHLIRLALLVGGPLHLRQDRSGLMGHPFGCSRLLANSPNHLVGDHLSVAIGYRLLVTGDHPLGGGRYRLVKAPLIEDIAQTGGPLHLAGDHLGVAIGHPLGGGCYRLVKPPLIGDIAQTGGPLHLGVAIGYRLLITEGHPLGGGPCHPVKPPLIKHVAQTIKSANLHLPHHVQHIKMLLLRLFKHHLLCLERTRHLLAFLSTSTISPLHQFRVSFDKRAI